MKNLTIKATLLTGFVLTLSACSGGGGPGGPGGGQGTVLLPLTGTDQSTLENNLGVQDGVAQTITGAVTRYGATQGEFEINYGSDDGQGNIDSPTMDGRFDVGAVGTFSTDADGVSTVDTVIMNGQVVRAAETNASGADIFYIPSAGSDMHVGMARRVTDDYGAVGIFGQRTRASDIATLQQNQTVATYTGVAEFAVNDNPGQTNHGYGGQMTATADFNNNSVSYDAQNMAINSNTGGPGTLTVTGTGVINNNGDINGGFTATGAINTTGDTTGGFYGPNAGNMGLIFVDPQADIAGGAILNQD